MAVDIPPGPQVPQETAAPLRRGSQPKLLRHWPKLVDGPAPADRIRLPPHQADQPRELDVRHFADAWRMFRSGGMRTWNEAPS